MRITELLDPRSISLTGAPATKKEALDQMVELMVKSGKIRDKEAYRQQVYAREEESTTGVGEGIAIPHGKGDSVIRPGLAAMVVKDGVDFDALDGEPVHLIFLIAAPNTRDNIHLDVLSKLSTLLMDETFVQNLQNASTVEEFLKIVDKADEEKPDLNEQLASQTLEDSSGKVCRIVAVTSCPTGIAHTYMAAEGLEKAAKKKNCRIKVETRGSGGAKNVLTEKEIQDYIHKLQNYYQVEYFKIDAIREETSSGELLRLIEVGASCFNHYCTGCDFSQRSVLHNVHRRIRSGYSIPTFCLCC